MPPRARPTGPHDSNPTQTSAQPPLTAAHTNSGPFPKDEENNLRSFQRFFEELKFLDPDLLLSPPLPYQQQLDRTREYPTNPNPQDFGNSILWIEHLASIPHNSLQYTHNRSMYNQIHTQVPEIPQCFTGFGGGTMLDQLLLGRSGLDLYPSQDDELDHIARSYMSQDDFNDASKDIDEKLEDDLHKKEDENGPHNSNREKTPTTSPPRSPKRPLIKSRSNAKKYHARLYSKHFRPPQLVFRTGAPTTTTPSLHTPNPNSIQHHLVLTKKEIQELNPENHPTTKDILASYPRGSRYIITPHPIPASVPDSSTIDSKAVRVYLDRCGISYEEEVVQYVEVLILHLIQSQLALYVFSAQCKFNLPKTLLPRDAMKRQWWMRREKMEEGGFGGIEAFGKNNNKHFQILFVKNGTKEIGQNGYNFENEKIIQSVGVHDARKRMMFSLIKSQTGGNGRNPNAAFGNNIKSIHDIESDNEGDLAETLNGNILPLTQDNCSIIDAHLVVHKIFKP